MTYPYPFECGDCGHGWPWHNQECPCGKVHAPIAVGCQYHMPSALTSLCDCRTAAIETATASPGKTT